MRIPWVRYGAGNVKSPRLGSNARICAGTSFARTFVLLAFSMNPPGGSAATARPESSHGETAHKRRSTRKGRLPLRRSRYKGAVLLRQARRTTRYRRAFGDAF